MSALSFVNTLQNEFGPIRGSGKVDPRKYSREQYDEYIDSGEYDPNNPTVYDINAAREGLKFRKEIGELKDALPTTTTTTTTTLPLRPQPSTCNHISRILYLYLRSFSVL